MTVDTLPSVWVFNGVGSSLPSAIFATREAADAWIEQTGVEGILTRYPLGISVYDWAIAQGHFKPKRDAQRTPGFIGRFTSAYLDHVHVGALNDPGDAP